MLVFRHPILSLFCVICENRFESESAGLEFSIDMKFPPVPILIMTFWVEIISFFGSGSDGAGPGLAAYFRIYREYDS